MLKIWKKNKILQNMFVALYCLMILFCLCGCPDEKQNNGFKKSSSKPQKAKYVKVEGGTFQMGNDHYGFHTVTLDSFMISESEVTQYQYENVMGKNPSYFEGQNLPVESVTWFNAIEYCNALSKKEGLTPCYEIVMNSVYVVDVVWNKNANGYRLPTEAEWEFAARGGIKSKGYMYSGSDDLGSVSYIDDEYYTTHPVMGKASNEIGLYDMTGNVSEWCWDWAEAYPTDSQINPDGPDGDEYERLGRFGTTKRIIRGGGCRSPFEAYFVSCRDAYYLNFYSSGTGFRVVRSASK